MLEILEDCIVFLNEKIYISALYRRHECAVQVKCSTSISVLYKKGNWPKGPKAHNKIYINTLAVTNGVAPLS